MNFGSIVVIVILAVIVILDIRYLRRGGGSCGGDCGKCRSMCKLPEDLKQARREIAAEKNK